MHHNDKAGAFAPFKAIQPCIGKELDRVENSLTEFTKAFGAVLANEWPQSRQAMEIGEMLTPVALYLNLWATQLGQILAEGPRPKRNEISVKIDGKVIFPGPVKSNDMRRITKAGQARIVQAVGHQLIADDLADWWRNVDLYLGMFVGLALSKPPKFERKNLQEIKKQATALRRSCEHFVKLAPNVSPSPLEEIGPLYLLSARADALLKQFAVTTKRGPKVNSTKKIQIDNLTKLFKTGFNLKASTQAENGPLNRFIRQAILEKTGESVPPSWLRSQTRDRVRVKSLK
ncbi:MAG: hypothetical protein B7Z75_10815 [Acidocella sp. 20-57-95]|nr:MAG: hypothetical protein B7Z75_10815 [Acidocella sp. 20-57-95]HQT63438.1 hypothetical protein [Acidocella sp.]